MSSDHDGEESFYRLTEPGVDVDNPFQFRTGYNIMPETVKGSEPVFQTKHEHRGESWILRWSKPRRGDPEYDLKREYERALKYLGLDDLTERSWKGDLPIAYVETPEASNSFEGTQIPELLGALNTGFSVTEALETHHRETGEGGSYYFSAGNPETNRVQRTEITDSAILTGIEGYSCFREEDLSQLGNPVPDTENLVSKLKKKTSDVGINHE